MVVYLKNSRIVNYLFVGICNTLFGYLLYALFIFIGLSFYIAAALSTIFGIFFNFKTISKYVFNSDNKKLFFRFLIVYIVGYLLGLSFIKLFSEMGFNYYISGFLAIVINAFITFILLNTMVYSKKK